MTQFVSSLVIYLVGDFVAQSIGPTPAPEAEAVVEEAEDTEKGWVQAWAAERDWARTGRALLIGGAAAVPGYKWFLWLSNSFNYSSKTLSLATKVCFCGSGGLRAGGLTVYRSPSTRSCLRPSSTPTSSACSRCSQA